MCDLHAASVGWLRTSSLSECGWLLGDVTEYQRPVATCWTPTARCMAQLAQRVSCQPRWSLRALSPEHSAPDLSLQRMFSLPFASDECLGNEDRVRIVFFPRFPGRLCTVDSVLAQMA